jgi:hypothetical protein
MAPSWDDNWMRKDESLYEYSSSLGRYVYHTTDQENVSSIREEGIKHDATLSSDTEAIVAILEEQGYADRFPFDRDSIVYCHILGNNLSDIYSGGGDNSNWADGRVVVVIDFEEIDTAAYLADMSVITDLIEHKSEVPENNLSTNSIEEAVSRYEETVETVESPVDIFTYPHISDGWPELLIDGDVPPAAIVDFCHFTSAEQ